MDLRPLGEGIGVRLLLLQLLLHMLLLLLLVVLVLLVLVLEKVSGREVRRLLLSIRIWIGGYC